MDKRKYNVIPIIQGIPHPLNNENMPLAEAAKPFEPRQGKLTKYPSVVSNAIEYGTRTSEPGGPAAQCNAVFDRDNIQVCWICGFPINADQESNDPSSFILSQCAPDDYKVSVKTPMLIAMTCEHGLFIKAIDRFFNGIASSIYDDDVPRLNSTSGYDNAHNFCNFVKSQAKILTITSSTSLPQISYRQIMNWPIFLYNATRGGSQSSSITIRLPDGTSELFINPIRAFLYLKWVELHNINADITFETVLNIWSKTLILRMIQRIELITNFFIDLDGDVQGLLSTYNVATIDEDTLGVLCNPLGVIYSNAMIRGGKELNQKLFVNLQYNKLMEILNTIPELKDKYLFNYENDEFGHFTINPIESAYSNVIYKDNIFKFKDAAHAPLLAANYNTLIPTLTSELDKIRDIIRRGGDNLSILPPETNTCKLSAASPASAAAAASAASPASAAAAAEGGARKNKKQNKKSHKKMKQGVKSKKGKHVALHRAKACSASHRLRRVLRSTRTTKKAVRIHR
jgi:hypothetical protein